MVDWRVVLCVGEGDGDWLWCGEAVGMGVDIEGSGSRQTNYFSEFQILNTYQFKCEKHIKRSTFYGTIHSKKFSFTI